MRKPDHLFENEEIRNKVLEGIHFGGFLSTLYRNRMDEGSREKRENIEKELLILMKKYRFSAETVRFLEVRVMNNDTNYNVSIVEQFTSGISKRTRLILSK